MELKKRSEHISLKSEGFTTFYGGHGCSITDHTNNDRLVLSYTAQTRLKIRCFPSSKSVTKFGGNRHSRFDFVLAACVEAFVHNSFAAGVFLPLAEEVSLILSG